MNRTEMAPSLRESHLVGDEKKNWNKSKYTATESRPNNPLQWLISHLFSRENKNNATQWASDKDPKSKSQYILLYFISIDLNSQMF